jgi:serine protease AprX
MKKWRNNKRVLALAAAFAVSGGGLGAINLATTGTQAWAACEGQPLDATSTTLPVAATDIGAPSLWAQGIDGAGIDVAVIDTGITAVPGLAGPDKFMDGADLSSDGQNPNLAFRDAQGHGTNMAGIIAGDGSGGPLTVGVAPKARIINVKVGAADGSADVSQVIAAVDWVVQNRNNYGRNIRVMNLSYTTDASTQYRNDPLAHAVENAWNAGIVVVASAGNEGNVKGRLGNPAMNPFVIAVGASARDAQSGAYHVPAWSSDGNGERNPDIVAPGEAIASLRVPGSLLDSTYPAARYFDATNCTSFFRGSGTSQSAAVTTGAVALLLQQRPTLQPNDVKALLRKSAKQIDGISEKRQGTGLISLTNALKTPLPLITRQFFMPSSGTGTLESSRGSVHVLRNRRGQSACMQAKLIQSQQLNQRLILNGREEVGGTGSSGAEGARVWFRNSGAINGVSYDEINSLTFVDPNVPVPAACAAPVAPPAPVAPAPTAGSWIRCAGEGQPCVVPGTTTVRYGANDTYVTLSATTSINCDNATFGDPVYGTYKACDYLVGEVVNAPTEAPTQAVVAGESVATPDAATTATKWNAREWASASNRGSAWTNMVFDTDGRMISGTWTGITWTGVTWTGITWSGTAWSGAVWTGVTWTGVTWTGVTWTGTAWSGTAWSGAVWT